VHYDLMSTFRATPGQRYIYAGLFVLSVVLGFLSAVVNGDLVALVSISFLPLIASLLNFRIGLVVLVMILPFQHTPLLPQFAGFNLINYFSIATLVSVGIHSNDETAITPRIPSKFISAYLLPVTIGALIGCGSIHLVPQQIIMAGNIYYSSVSAYLIGFVVKPFLLFLCTWLIAYWCVNSKKPERLIGLLIGSMVTPALAVTIFSLFGSVSISDLANERSREVLGALGMHANEFGLLFGTDFCICLFLLPEIDSVKWKAYAVLTMTIVSTAMLLTFSRGAYVIAIIGIIGFLASRPRGRWVPIVLTSVALLVMFAPDVFVSRLGVGLSDVRIDDWNASKSDDKFTAGRLWLWHAVIPDVVANPVFGSGIGAMAWSRAVIQDGIGQIHPHNLFVRVILDLGIVGFALIAWCMYSLFRNLGRVASAAVVPKQFRALSKGTGFALIGTLIAGWANGKYIPDPELTTLCLAVGLLLPYLSPHHTCRSVQNLI
jgi:O-antigen ligase